MRKFIDAVEPYIKALKDMFSPERKGERSPKDQSAKGGETDV